jgi:hypothetical protein
MKSVPSKWPMLQAVTTPDDFDKHKFVPVCIVLALPCRGVRFVMPKEMVEKAL